MKSIRVTSLAAAAVFAISASAMAQTGTSSGSMSNGNSMSNSKSMSNSAMPTNCQGMMDKANGMAMPTDAAMKAKAMKEMDLAKSAMAAGQEQTCMKHMKMAMHDMM